jgi:hypothetical protein
MSSRNALVPVRAKCSLSPLEHKPGNGSLHSNVAILQYAGG